MSNEEIARLKEIIYSGDDSQIKKLYFETFGETVKKGCGNCYNKAVEKLHLWLKSKIMKEVKKDCAYRFKKEFKGKNVVMRISGTLVTVNENNLTNELAQLLIDNKRDNCIEPNESYVAVEPVKKLKPIDFANLEEKKTEDSQPTLSTLKKAESDGAEPKQSSEGKELDVKESKPLQEAPLKKRGRPAKK